MQKYHAKSVLRPRLGHFGACCDSALKAQGLALALRGTEFEIVNAGVTRQRQARRTSEIKRRSAHDALVSR